jgi:two-component system alkaline phosphatase synthesis response regulator PhoP
MAIAREHTDQHYESELRELHLKLLEMGGFVEKQIANAITSLVRRDDDLARLTIERDHAANKMDVEIDELCLRLLALHQPAARDLRLITTALKITTDLERIGDMAVNICERVLELNQEPQLKPMIDIPRMAEIAAVMLRESLDAFVRGDVDLALKVCRDDDMIDDTHDQPRHSVDLHRQVSGAHRRSRHQYRRDGRLHGEGQEHPSHGRYSSIDMNDKQHVLVVEDEEDISELIRFNLEQEGFSVSTVTDGERALEEAKRSRPALLLLDLMLPGMPGIEVCKRLRSDVSTARLPIIIVTAKATETDRVLGLEMGADDYLVKPFSTRELVARVRAVMRRAYDTEVERAPQVYEKGRLKLDLDTYEVFADGKPISLSLREFELLRFFVRSPNRVYDRLQLLDLVWGQDTHVEPRTVDVHIRRLRKRIERDDANPELILTVRGVGYKFNDRALEP